MESDAIIVLLIMLETMNKYLCVGVISGVICLKCTRYHKKRNGRFDIMNTYTVHIDIDEEYNESILEIYEIAEQEIKNRINYYKKMLLSLDNQIYKECINKIKHYNRLLKIITKKAHILRSMINYESL